ncbi:MAB_1171c family putative transporter [Streptomyces chrestomyceticus]|uniref:MAB_1171c family putative transporter n=1 Tax=Streptomyces chrestomyceticus TaxID=68185 RepID=UPI0019CFC613|nr:MAB_1171c family putative transporter [Streptomyces chrestomyceticus]
MFDVLYLCSGGAAWAVVAFKTRAWLGDRGNTDLGLTCVMSACVATGFLFSAPGVYRWLDRLTGVPNLSMVVLYSAVVVFAAGAFVLMLRWNSGTGAEGRARARTRSRAAVAVVAVTWAVAVLCFAVGRPDDVEHPRDFSTAYTGSPGVMTFLVLYLAIFGASLAGLGTLCPRYARQVGPSWLARGLRVLAMGCWLGLVYCAGKLAGFVLSWAGHDAPWLSNGVAPLSASVAAVLVLTGLALPAVGTRAYAWRRLRRLHPLWKDVAAQAPEVAARRPAGAGRWRLTGLQRRADRQMAEIRDVQRGIRRYVESDTIDIARERGRAVVADERQLAAVAEAAALRRGLENRAIGLVPALGSDSVVVMAEDRVGERAPQGAAGGRERLPGGRAGCTCTGGVAELAAEFEHLARVADVYHSPLTDTVLTELRQRSATRRH